MELKRDLLVFFQLLYRDFYVFSRRSIRYLINYTVIIPAVYSLGYGYFLPQIIFGSSANHQALVMFIGVSIFVMFPLAFAANIELMFDLQNDKFIEYQILHLSPSFVLFEKIIFSTFYIFFTLMLFFPMSMIFIYDVFSVAIISWSKMILVILLGSFMASAFFIGSFCYFKNTSQFNYYWKYVCYPMLQLGGFLTPWSVIYKASSFLGYFVFLNPIIYFTEGLRRAFIPNGDFFPFYICVLVLILFSVFFLIGSWIAFKKKLDHI